MNLSTVQQVGLTLPPTVVEQEAIATALSDADALIKSLEQLLVKKRQIKQGAMQELLTGKKRLPGFSELWMETTIGDAVERIVGGGTPSRMVPGYWGGDVPWMTVKDFAHHDTRGTIEYITREGLKRSASNLIPKGTLITSTRMALGKAVVFEVDVSINQDLKALFPKPSIDTRFLYYWFEANQQGIAEIGSGSTVMGISLGELRKIPFVKPSLREQQAIASVLTVMDAELETIERKLTKACQLKQGMMQELLTGKIRLGRPSADVLSFPTKKSSSVADVSHNTHFNEAVVIAVLSAKFGSEKFPLGRFRRTKFSYLLHRHVEHEAVGFMKMAAGPYNPNTRYGGAEKIALQNRYVRVLTTGKSEGFVADENIAQAEGYFEKWYGVGVLTWLKQFHYYKNDALGLLTTVDMACEDLSRTGKAATLSAVKQVIRDNPKWKPKLDRPEFSDDNIEKTIQSCGQLFPIGKE
jgi:type I restriction enzyme S subunit